MYLAYLDSINLFRPSHLRTLVYQQLLIAYFEHVRSLGYSCHLINFFDFIIEINCVIASHKPARVWTLGGVHSVTYMIVLALSCRQSDWQTDRKNQTPLNAVLLQLVVVSKARFPLPELSDGPHWRLTSFYYPSTRVVLTGAQFPLPELTGRVDR